MTLYKVCSYYDKYDTLRYEVIPYDLIGHLKCCFKWYGLKGLKYCYLFRKQAERKAEELNLTITIV